MVIVQVWNVDALSMGMSSLRAGGMPASWLYSGSASHPPACDLPAPPKYPTRTTASPSTPCPSRQSLLEDVNVQNTQHDAAAAAHADVLDTLLSLHRERTDGAQQRFEGELKAVQEEFERCGDESVGL